MEQIIIETLERSGNENYFQGYNYIVSYLYQLFENKDSCVRFLINFNRLVTNKLLNKKLCDKVHIITHIVSSWVKAHH